MIELENANKPTELTAARKKLTDNQKLLADLLQKLAARKQNSLPDMVFIGDACARIELLEVAADQYSRILVEKKGDPKFPQAEMRVRAALAGLLRRKATVLVQDGKSDDAIKTFKSALEQIDAMIKTQPRALEPKMERGRILQDWSKIDSKKFQEAISHWTQLRKQLAGSVGKKPPEYYEVVYLAAECLYTQSQKLANKPDEAKQVLTQAEQLLNASLVLSPKLNGADTVARYKELLKKIQELLKKTQLAQGPVPVVPAAPAKK